jgi:diacylglycerol kinase family enzyme
MTKRIACIYNKGSGTIANKEQIQEVFTQLGVTVDFLDIHVGEDALTKDLKDNLYDCVVAAGGDGTVRLTAQLAVGSNLNLGVLPLGTLNHFAKDVGLPPDLESAAKTIAGGVVSPVDYCTVNDQVFVNNASLGIYPATVKNRDKMLKAWGKWLAGAKALISALRSNQNLHCSVITPDGKKSYSSPLIFVGNNPYTVDKIGVGNREDLTVGKMFLYIARTSKRRKLLALAVLHLFGIHPQTFQTNTETTGPLTIESAKSPTTIALDGETVTMNFPLRFKIHAKSLKVMTDHD